MRPHIHTDVISILVTTAAVLATAHVLRWGGAYLASKGMSGPGQALGAFASLN